MSTMTRQPRRQGLAMVMVLTVVAAAGILAYAMLATAATRSKIADASVYRVQRQYLAESGLNLGVYYLRNPAKSPVALVLGASGNTHYPGESSIQVGDMPGRLTITVTNPSNNKFLIVSTATYNGDSMTSRAVVNVERSKTFANAANLSGDISLNNKVTITGGLVTDGTVTSVGALLSGVVQALNGVALGGTTNSTSQITTSPTMPSTMPYYYVDGKRYTAKKLAATVTAGSLLDTDTTNNPYNVWYSDTNVRFAGTTTVDGSVIMTGSAQLQMAGSLDVRPSAGMVGLSVSGNISYALGGNTLRVRGPTYLKGQVVATTLLATPKLIVEGTFLSGRTGWPVSSSYKGSVEMKLDSSRATIKGFSDDLEEITAIRAESWETDNGRPL